MKDFGIGLAVGLAVVLILGLTGCGDVAALPLDGGVDTTGMAGTTGGAGSGGSAGSAGTAGRPLGAGCMTDDQCGSGICDGATSACCDGRAGECATCIGGYLTPKADGTACGTLPVSCSESTKSFQSCQGGTCAAITLDCKSAVGLCDPTTNDPCKPDSGGCDVGTFNGCYCTFQASARTGTAIPCQ